MSQIEALTNYYNSRFEYVQRCKELANEDPDERVSNLIELNNECLLIKEHIVKCKEALKDWRDQVNEANKLLGYAKNWTLRYKNQSQIPVQALRKSNQHVSRQTDTIKSAQDDASQVKQAIPKENVRKPMRQIGQVEYITVNQFSTIPKYMKGRATYDMVNAAVDELNAALTEKYNFLSRKLTELPNQAAKKRWNVLKSQESKDTKGIFFVTHEDLRSSVNLKSETNRRNLLAILRHFGLLREVRGPGSIVRFAVITKKK